MPSIFSPFDVRVDPWQVDYGAETPLEPIDDVPDETVSADVDIPASEWRPVVPRPVTQPGRICFVDGIRRLDSRLLVRRESHILHGCFGSFAVGFVRIQGSRATFGAAEIGRQIILG